MIEGLAFTSVSSEGTRVTNEPPLGSVDKTLLALIRLGDAGAEGETLARLATDLKQSKATLHRALAALRYRGFVEQDLQTGRYRLGPELLAVADRYLREGSLRHLFHEPLRALSSDVGELCHLGVLAGNEIVYIDKVEPARAIRVWSEIGRRAPAVTTALGRAILSQLHRDEAEFEALFASPVTSRTPSKPSDPEKVWAELVAARSRGYAKEEQENETGICCLGVAIMRANLPIAAISITGLQERMAGGRMDELASALRANIGPSLPPGLSLQPIERQS